jgi:D-threo-aldose 1-dehydrogenase
MGALFLTSFRGIVPAGAVRLGFGCGGLGSRAEKKHALALLETALDCGVTYYDTARMYGEGATESILGEFVPKNRRRIVLTSKAGILPTDRSLSRRARDKSARALRTVLPPIRRFVPDPPHSAPRFHVFGPGELRASVDASLRALRTDHLDILLLHECNPSDVTDPLLEDFLDSLMKQGKIRAFGIATGISDSIEIIRTHPGLASVVQIPSSPCDSNIAKVDVTGSSLIITHSCFSACLASVAAHLRKDSILARKWRSRIGISDASELGRLLLAHALHSNPNGVVLFSSSRTEHIRANVATATDQIPEARQLESLTMAISEFALTH